MGATKAQPQTFTIEPDLHEGRVRYISQDGTVAIKRVYITEYATQHIKSQQLQWQIVKWETTPSEG